MPTYPLGPVNMVGQSMTLPAKAQGMFEGGMKMQAQGMDGRKPGNRIFNISPAVNGKTVWNLDADGPLNLSTEGTWTITPLSSFTANVKAWGEGGKQDRAGPFGAGAFAGGTLSAVAGEALLAGVGQDRGAGSPLGPSPGGGWTGLLINSSSVALLIAGAGGGGGYLGVGPATGGAGGYPNGAAGGADGPTDQGGAGATQSAPGAGGVSTATLFPTNGGNGSGKTGGGGGYGGGGGGGGYFGGGGGAGSDFRGAGGGGGSSYFSPTRILNQLMLSGSGTTPGNASDPARNSAGEQHSGRLIIL